MTNAEKFKEVFGFEPNSQICYMPEDIKCPANIECDDCQYNLWLNEEYVVPVAELNKLPPVTPQPKKGHWIKSNIGGAKVCSVCNAHMGLSNFKYCPSCGADMRADREESKHDKI